jgi:1-acyl-sn-glycerol-3-phosphate acyltransferase
MSSIAWLVAPSVIRIAARVLWRIEHDPGPGFPPPPFVIAANHYSFLDPPLIGALYGRPIRFLALAELFGNHRLLDWSLRAFNVIEVPRGARPLAGVRRALAHLAAGGVVGVFPEGRRVVRFGDVPPKHGAAWLAVRSGAPLLPVAITGTEQVFGIDNKLRSGRVKVRVGPALQPSGTSREAVGTLTGRWQEWVSSAVG